jgi:hypothetical protein
MKVFITLGLSPERCKVRRSSGSHHPELFFYRGLNAITKILLVISLGKNNPKPGDFGMFRLFCEATFLLSVACFGIGYCAYHSTSEKMRLNDYKAQDEPIKCTACPYCGWAIPETWQCVNSDCPGRNK